MSGNNEISYTKRPGKVILPLYVSERKLHTAFMGALGALDSMRARLKEGVTFDDIIRQIPGTFGVNPKDINDTWQEYFEEQILMGNFSDIVDLEV